VEAARPATGDDLPALVVLAQAALDELAPTRGGEVFVAREARPSPVEASLAADVADPDVLVLAGTIDDTFVVGYAVGRTETLRDGSVLGRITDLFVEPEARAVGVGEALMDALLPWFRERDCRGVDATALPGNRQTKNFFEMSGFTARLLVMHHRFER
jgi:ribosomal protein S18 acetylase RimI-like enzyme